MPCAQTRGLPDAGYNKNSTQRAQQKRQETISRVTRRSCGAWDTSPGRSYCAWSSWARKRSGLARRASVRRAFRDGFADVSMCHMKFSASSPPPMPGAACPFWNQEPVLVRVSHPVSFLLHFGGSWLLVAFTRQILKVCPHHHIL